MTVSIVGSKYGAQVLASAATNSVEVSGTPFSGGDFSVARAVALWDSSAAALKGMTYVRRMLSDHELELERGFFDIRTGEPVTQTSGDVLHVSLNWSDIATTGIAVADTYIYLTDRVDFGDFGVSDGCFFWDQNKIVDVDSSGAIHLVGGLFADGHLVDFRNRVFFGGSFFSARSNGVNLHRTEDSQVRSACYGSKYVTHGSIAGSVNYGPASDEDIFFYCEFDNTDVTAPGDGALWSNGGDRHVQIGCKHQGVGVNSILNRWGDGVVEEGTYTIPRYASSPISAFGADSAGDYDLHTAPPRRAIVSDLGDGNALIRSNTDVVQDWDIINMLAPHYRAGYSLGDVDNTNATQLIRFSSLLTNLDDGTAVAALVDSDWSIDDAQTAADNQVVIHQLHRTWVGFTEGSYRGDWTIRVRRWGFNFIEFAAAEEDYDLGAAGVAKNIQFSQSLVQTPHDLGVSEATALAYPGITVTDEGATPATWEGNDYSITVEVDLDTYPSTTKEMVFAHVIANLSNHATWGDRSGMQWHPLMSDEGGVITTLRGVSGGAGATLKGVRVIDQDGNAFPGISAMTADDGTVYTPPITVTVRVTCVDKDGSPVQNARVYIEAGSGGPATVGDVLLTGLTDGSGILQDAGYLYAGDQPLQNAWARKASGSPFYKEAKIQGTIEATGFNVTVTMIAD